MSPYSYPDLEPQEIGAAIKAFMAEDCPACGTRKDRLGDPFCISCTALLPPDLRDGVVDKQSFIQTFHPAIAHLRSARR